jgi:hypothetical protein
MARADSTTKTIKAKCGQKANKKVPVAKNPNSEDPEANDSTTKTIKGGKKVNKVPAKTAAIKIPAPEVEAVEMSTSKPGNLFYKFVVFFIVKQL